METLHLRGENGNEAGGRDFGRAGRLEYTRVPEIATDLPALPPMTASSQADHGPDRPWESCVVPLVVFLAAGMLEPTPSNGGLAGLLGVPYTAYPLIYAARLVATVIAIGWAWRPIRAWVGHTTWWPIALGGLLMVPWVVLAAVQREAGWAPDAVERSAFNPFAHFPTAAGAWGFLLVRGLGLVVVVPLIEELFLRGFLMRYVIDERFWTVPFGKLTLASATACLVYAAATHPAEAVAALGWFAVMSGVAAATRRPIDVILAHAATNLALGIYVVATGSWWLL